MLVGGKGGVGKTTCAAAIAARTARRGERTLLLSTDPACALADAIGAAITGQPTAIAEHDGLFAMQLDPAATRDAFLARWRAVLVEIVDRGTYLDRDDATGLIDAALPGIDETMALLAIPSLDESARWDRIVLDTAPTGHTLRLLSLPEAFAALVRLLDAMQEKHRFMVRALTHRYRSDDADRFLAEIRSDVERVSALLRDRERLAAVLVTRDEPVVRAESERYAGALASLGVRIAAVVHNASESADAPPVTDAMQLSVPRIEPAPFGLPAIERWGDAMTLGSSAMPRAAKPRRSLRRATHEERAVLRRPLLIVAGKGGVGKTTVSCAIAIDAARESRVLLVSTDPAPSLGDALAQPIGDREREVSGVPRLVARELDAVAAFARFRETYAARVDALFDALMGGSLDAAADRAIVHDLLALAPPGIDELYALASLGESLDDGRYDSIVIDPAPTGHLLRLLDMPELAIDWTHRLMRLILKYKAVVSLGDAASELLAFAKRTRALHERLTDRARAGALVVTLDEPLVERESDRLRDAIRARGIDVVATLVNRSGASEKGDAWHAPLVEPPPRGVERLREWIETWSAERG